MNDLLTFPSFLSINKKLNVCRLYLRVIFLINITNLKGDFLLPNIMIGICTKYHKNKWLTTSKTSEWSLLEIVEENHPSHLLYLIFHQYLKTSISIKSMDNMPYNNPLLPILNTSKTKYTKLKTTKLISGLLQILTRKQ